MTSEQPAGDSTGERPAGGSGGKNSRDGESGEHGRKRQKTFDPIDCQGIGSGVKWVLHMLRKKKTSTKFAKL